MSQPAYPSHVSPKTVQIPNQCTHISFIPLLLFRHTKIVNWNTRVQYMISLIIINLLQTHIDTGLLDYCNRYEEKCFTKKSTDSLLLSSFQILPGTPTEEINSPFNLHFSLISSVWDPHSLWDGDSLKFTRPWHSFIEWKIHSLTRSFVQWSTPTYS